MAYDIGTARGVIEMEYNGRGISEAKSDLNSLEETGGKAGVTMDQVGRNAGRVGLVMATALAGGVAAAASFEERLSAIKAVSGATADEMERVSDKALQLGKDTQFSAGESAQAMEELIKAGLTVDEVLNGAADATVALAAAGAVDMPAAATIAANAMNQFNLNAEDMMGVVDNIAGAANASAIDVGEFGQSLQQVGAVANLTGLSFEDTATAIAIMGNAGIKGSDAGTSLKTMLQNLQPTTEKQINLFKELGIVTKDGSNQFFDAQGNIKSMSQVSGVLSNALKGMTKQQKTMALETMFGTDAIRAAAILANNGAKGFDKMSQSMGKVKAADVAATRMDNFKGSLEEMKGSLETMAIVVGGVLLPPLRQIVDGITSAVNAFSNLSDSTQKWIVAGFAAVAGILLLISAIIKIVQFIQAFKAALVAIRAAMALTWVAALGPIALVIAAIAAIIAIVVLLWKKSETFRTVVLAVWGAIKDGAQAVADWFMGSFLPALQAVWDGLVTAVMFAFNLIKTIITTYFNIYKTIIMTALAVIKAVWNAVWGTFGPVIRAIFNVIVAIIKLAWTIIKGVFLLQLRAIKAVVTTVFGFIKAYITTVLNVIRSIVQAVWGFIGPYIRGVVNGIKSAISTAWNAIKAATTAMWNAFKSIVVDNIAQAYEKITGIRDKIVGFFANAGSWLIDAGKAIIQGLLDGIESMMGAVEGKIESVTDKISGFLPGSPVKEGPLKKLNRGHAGKEIIKMVITGIEEMATPLARAMDGAVEVPTGYSGVPAGSTGKPRGKRGGGARSRLRLVDGELRLDESGRAFITGLASEADVADDDYDDTLERMNR